MCYSAHGGFLISLIELVQFFCIDYNEPIKIVGSDVIDYYLPYIGFPKHKPI